MLLHSPYGRVTLVTVLVLGVVALGAALVVQIRAPEAASAPHPTGYFGAGYAGSQTCGTCHQKIYDTFRATGHPVKLRPAAEARAAGVPKPDFVEWNEILYVIGGFRWKARYVDQNGYIITGSADGKVQGRNQFNLENSSWTNYNAGRQKMVYDCGECHTTGYAPVGNQLRKPGLQGTWALDGIQCEACHGRGAVHAKSPSKANIRIDRSAALCGQCHRRGTDMAVIPAAGGFIEHREQYQEFLRSKHSGAGLTCVTCHDPHRRARELKTAGQCSACHTGTATAFRGSRHQRAGLTCESCHMANVARNALARTRWEADAPTHLVKIITDPAVTTFNAAGNAVAGDGITTEFTCLRCHSDRNKAWAATASRGIHSLGK